MSRPAVTIIAALAVLGASACGRSETPAPAGAPVGPFAYDRALPLSYADRGVVNHDYPIEVHDVSYAAAGRRVDGYLAVPPGKGPFPAVIYLHGSGGDRTQLLVPATWMAARGVVALTITMPSDPATTGTAAQRLAAQRRATVATVVAVRRAVDALGALPKVDASRIGLVGWSSGARVGAILAGVEPRIEAFDLMSGGSPPVREYAAQAPAALRPTVIRELGAVDPLRWVARARSHTILLQDGRHDEVVPAAALRALAKAAGPAAELRWYGQGHAPSKAAYVDQLRWLAGKLGVGGPVVPGAASGP
jgi:dienelactone hydrolase